MVMKVKPFSAIAAAGGVHGHTLFTMSVFAALVAGAAVVKPKATDEVLCNPGMGFVHFYYSSRIWAYGAQTEPGDTLDWMPGTTVIYMRLPWSYIEPEEGVYRWDLLDSKTAPPLKPGERVYLVCDGTEGESFAAVTVNGAYAGGFIGAPYRLDITRSVKAGANTLEAKPFRMINPKIVEVNDK